METKTAKIKQYLEAGNYINDMKAVEIAQSYRLSAIIYALRHNYGLDIRDRWIENPNTHTRYKEYYLFRRG